MMRILTVVGARPQFIKAAVVSRAIRAHNSTAKPPVKELILHTGQHYDDNMSQVFFEELDIPRPTYNLGIHGSTHGAMTGRMLESIEDVLHKEEPDWVLVYGDTNSTLAGALAAKKLHHRLAHVEAGLRSFSMRMPEEQNRLLADRLSDVLFCPTESAVSNLKNEGIGNSPYGETVVNVGDVMYDAHLFYSDISKEKTTSLNRPDITAGEYVLATVHRQENTNSVVRLRKIILGLEKIAKKISVILPLHPRTRKILTDSKRSTQGITIIDPVSFFEMMQLEKQCQVIITDSGGIQKEAYFCQKPCITIRDETEWIELVKAGVNFVVGANTDNIVGTFDRLRTLDLEFSQRFYGNGNAGEKIVEFLINSFYLKNPLGSLP